MYREFTNEIGLHTIEIKCDKCPSRMELAGTQAKEEKNKTLLSFGWRVNPQARKYYHLCINCTAKLVAARERKSATVRRRATAEV